MTVLTRRGFVTARSTGTGHLSRASPRDVSYLRATTEAFNLESLTLHDHSANHATARHRPSHRVQGRIVMAAEEPRGLYLLASLVMIAVLVCDFIWVATTALHAMH